MTDITPAAKRQRLIVWIVVAVVGVCTAIGVTALLWQPDAAPVAKTYVSPDFGYTAVFPGNPTRVEDSQEIGTLVVETYAVSWGKGDVSYLVNTALYPDEIEFFDEDLEANLDNSVNGMIDSVAGSSLVESHDESLGGDAGRGGTIALESGATQRFVVAFHGGAQYLLITNGTNAADHEAFVASFEFGA